MKFTARYYDGLRASAHEVRATLNDQSLSFDVSDKHYAYQTNEFTIQPALAQATRIIELHDGGRLEVLDATQILLKKNPDRKSSRFVFALENNLRYVAVALIATAVLIWGFISYGVPFIAEQVAHAIPLTTETAMGDQVLQAMDLEERVFQPSALSVSRQNLITKNLLKLCHQQAHCPTYKLLFRKSSLIGANAFALPGGTLIITDGLVHLAQTEDEITAVLAHELGHISRRHAMRQVLQSTLSGLVMVAILGDFDSLASGLPASLLQLRYTRVMELEADAYALQALQTACISPLVFAQILDRLNGTQAKNSTNKTEHDVARLFATHPDTAIRLKSFREARSECKQ